MTSREAYNLLGVENGSSEREVRRAYRALLFQLEDEGRSAPDYPERRKALDEALALALAGVKERSATPVADAPVEGGQPGQRVAMRLAIGLLGIAGLVAGYQWLKGATVDPTGETPSDTAGMVAAIEHVEGGTRVVVFDKEGQKKAAPGSEGRIEERDLVWRPDGNRLLWVSDRGGDIQIYRWDPTKEVVEKRSVDSRGKSALYYGPQADQTRALALVTVAGRVFEYDQREGAFKQVLPPSIQRTTTSDEGEGAVGQMEALYRQIAQSFLEAKGTAGGELVWSRMRRDADEVFVANPLVETLNNGRPMPLAAARKIDFDVAPNGDAVVALREYQFLDPTQVPPENLVDGRPVPPFDSAVLLVPPSLQSPAVALSTKGNVLFAGPPGAQAVKLETRPKGSYALGQPRVSPDGSRLAVVIGQATPEGGLKGEGLVVFPLNQEAGPPRKVAVGEIADPSWSPDSKRIVFSVREPGKLRVVFTVPIDGGTPQRFSGEGDYTNPVFSPQVGTDGQG